LSWNNSNTSHERGKITETFAENYLIKQGLTSIDRNVHCRQGEIDLVMRDDDIIVFIEVKYRKNNHFGGAIEAVSIAKQNKIRHCVAYFFQQANLNEYNTPCRFDVIALEGNINQPQVTWLKNAF
jgi:putative endonuclease